ncbi:tetratricopeptide repeat protein [Limnofasciculus baicalensis]|uniref:Tetratricopeptide repeat protein n=1 Tax=Limnofasciculus baicalensis BBK-W-15 TaxID=2699891 RepID=A0AAE3GUE6_9CYAN|nr:tetratricopeptide repeat protein [Limnofasciculus baicalensis]MCP2728752.1 tetratricopeptide repeat protein [Limnofasciculus baicalensis BBK-W-15]
MRINELNYSELEELVREEDYQGAEAFCQSVLETGVDNLFWQTQIGYICFLNETDIEAYYERSPSVFQSLVIQYPEDANAHFWLGYIYCIVFNDIDNARQQLREVLKINLNHPYANLVLASIPDTEDSAELLRRVLQQQPTNFRALRQMADLLLVSKQKSEALQLLRIILTHEAYIEQNYGIMNLYINEVLTGATNQQTFREGVEANLAQLEG